MANEAARRAAAEIIAKWRAVKNKRVDVTFNEDADPDVVKVLMDAMRGDLYTVADELDAALALVAEYRVALSQITIAPDATKEPNQ